MGGKYRIEGRDEGEREKEKEKEFSREEAIEVCLFSRYFSSLSQVEV